MSMSYLGKDIPASALAVYSGGLDSTTLLCAMKQAGVDIRGAITIDYGQKHRKEIECAKEICQRLGVEQQVADLRQLAPLFGESSLISESQSIPEGHYEEESMKSTVVPNRNMILISIATALALSKEAEAVAYAAHAGDHAIYPDCRESFADALDKALGLCDWKPIKLFRPFLSLRKSEIVKLGAEIGAPLELTWSCYRGVSLHCGRCGTCVERREAFHLAGIADPTNYEAGTPPLESLLASKKDSLLNRLQVTS